MKSVPWRAADRSVSRLLVLSRGVEGTFSWARNQKHIVDPPKKGSWFLTMSRCQLKCQWASTAVRTTQAGPLVLHMELMIERKPTMKSEWAMRTRATDHIWYFLWRLLCHPPVDPYSMHSRFSRILWPVNYIQLNTADKNCTCLHFSIQYTILVSSLPWWSELGELGNNWLKFSAWMP